MQETAGSKVKQPPLAVLAVVMLDIVAASSSIFVVDEIGPVAASLEFLVFAGLAIGLWRLKKWAWATEIAISTIQIVFLLVGGAFVLFDTGMLEMPKGFATEHLYLLLVSLIAINAFIVTVLSAPKVRTQFS